MEYSYSDGVINVRYEEDYKITHVNAEYENDRENMIGVSRIVSVEIETDGEASEQIIEEIQDDVYNRLADHEYFDEDPNWREDAAGDVAGILGVEASIVDAN